MIEQCGGGGLDGGVAEEEDGWPRRGVYQDFLNIGELGENGVGVWIAGVVPGLVVGCGGEGKGVVLGEGSVEGDHETSVGARDLWQEQGSAKQTTGQAKSKQAREID